MSSILVTLKEISISLLVGFKTLTFMSSLRGPFPASFLLYFRLFNVVDSTYKIFWWLDWNREPLVLQVTALPTEPQPLQSVFFLFLQFILTAKRVHTHAPTHLRYLMYLHTSCTFTHMHLCNYKSHVPTHTCTYPSHVPVYIMYLHISCTYT